MKRNVLAKSMRENRIIRQKLVPSKKLYNRKNKYKD